MTSLSISTPPPSPPPPPPPPPPPATPPAVTRSHHIKKWFSSPMLPVRALFSNPSDTASPPLSHSSSLSCGKEGRNAPMVAESTKPLHSMDYFNEDVAGEHTSIYLLISFFNSGLIDSVVFDSWSCFVGMQTGNTIFAALGLSGQPSAFHPRAYFKSLTSIMAFCLGTLFFSAFHRIPSWFDPNPVPSRRRFILIGSFTIQTVFIMIAAILVRVGLISSRPSIAGAFSSGNHLSKHPNPEKVDNYMDLFAIALLAFQAAGPVFFSRVLGIIELPTIVLSTLYCDFVADLYRLPSSLRNKTSWYAFFVNDERRQFRRLGSILMLFLGGILGGIIFRSRVGMVGAFWLAAGLKGLLVLGWIFWKPEERRLQEEGEA